MSDGVNRTFQGKRKKPMMFMEAIVDGKIWISGFNVGSQGSLNDINVLITSLLLTDILQGNLLPSYNYKLNGTNRDGTYFPIDGIYLSWAIFINKISEPSTKKESCFSAAQEEMKKDVKRAFGVLLS